MKLSQQKMDRYIVTSLCLYYTDFISRYPEKHRNTIKPGVRLGPAAAVVLEEDLPRGNKASTE